MLDLACLDLIQVHMRDQEFIEKVHILELDSLAWDSAAMKSMQCNLFNNINDEGSPISNNARGLALNSSGLYNHIISQSRTSFPKLRSLLCFSQPTEIEIGGKVSFPSSRFKLLMVLDLEDMYFIGQLGEEIGELVQLRYLGIWMMGVLTGIPWMSLPLGAFVSFR